MSASYFICPIKPFEPAENARLRIDPRGFSRALIARWADAQIEPAQPGSGLATDWSVGDPAGVEWADGRLFESFITYRGPQGALIVAIALWFRELIPAGQPLYFYLEGYTGFIQLMAGMSAKLLASRIARKGW